MICIQMKDYLLIRLVVLIYLNEPHLGKHIKKEKKATGKRWHVYHAWTLKK